MQKTSRFLFPRSAQTHTGARPNQLEEARPEFANERLDVGLARKLAVPQIEVEPLDERIVPFAEQGILTEEVVHL